MSKAYPSMLALLGLIAVAGYQNRDKIAEMIGGLKGNDRQPDGQPDPQGRLEGTRGPQGGVGDLLSSCLRPLTSTRRRGASPLERPFAWRASSARMGQGGNRPVDVDGELVTHTPAIFRVLPDAIEVIVPAESGSDDGRSASKT